VFFLGWISITPQLDFISSHALQCSAKHTAHEFSRLLSALALPCDAHIALFAEAAVLETRGRSLLRLAAFALRWRLIEVGGRGGIARVEETHRTDAEIAAAPDPAGTSTQQKHSVSEEVSLRSRADGFIDRLREAQHSAGVANRRTILLVTDTELDERASHWAAVELAMKCGVFLPMYSDADRAAIVAEMAAAAAAAHCGSQTGSEVADADNENANFTDRAQTSSEDGNHQTTAAPDFALFASRCAANLHIVLAFTHERASGGGGASAATLQRLATFPDLWSRSTAVRLHPRSMQDGISLAFARLREGLPASDPPHLAAYLPAEYLESDSILTKAQVQCRQMN
jgi:hypothetical protein